jgi:Nitrile hydratase beta subunit, N-terminal
VGLVVGDALLGAPGAARGHRGPRREGAGRARHPRLHDRHRRAEWSEFQLSLIESIKRWEAGDGGEPWSYYEHWLTALETVLAGNGALSDADLDDATKAVLATPPDKGHHEAHREPVAVDPAR